ncbi:MAG: trypsin-like peptidase domain-containing protein [Planctomycetaceae bacterium]|nr:trypsin-like peptidase domain-containing protein [Planctomycetaceae bacterium]
MKRTFPQMFALFLLWTVGGLFAESKAHANEDVYAKAVRSTVLVITSSASGSGVLVDQERRWIVTNEHVIEGHEDVNVYFPAENHGLIESELNYYQANRSQLEIPGKVIALCKRRDLALVELERLPADIPAIPFGKSAKPGQLLHSIGNPSASDALWVYTNGYVRANYFKSVNGCRMQVVETSSPINPGDSGGPILNSEGQLVGISQSFHKEGRLVSNGVDISEVIWFVNKHRRHKADSAVVTDEKPVTSDSEPKSDALVATPNSLLGLLAGAKQ